MSSQAMPPLPFVAKWMEENLTDKTVLDYACGTGRHGRLAAARGAKVTFTDINLEKVDDLLSQENITLLQADLEQEDEWPLEGRQYDLVIVTNYLFRSRLQDIFSLVTEGGMILYQTFALGNEKYGRPSNPDFLLRSGELRNYCGGFDILHFEEGIVHQPSQAVIQRLAARRCENLPNS